MAEPGRALHKALFARLSSELSCAVYDAVPQTTAYPYVTLDTEVSNNFDFLTSRKQERFHFLTVWSESKGQEEIKGIFGEIDAALDGYSFTLDTGTVVSVLVDGTSTRRDADNVTFSGTVILRIVTEH